jgi:LemA protein
VARNRYIKAVQEYNVTVRSFPSNLTAMMFGYKTKPSFTVEDEKTIAEPPKVEFGAPAAAPGGAGAPALPPGGAGAPASPPAGAGAPAAPPSQAPAPAPAK